MAGHTSNRTPFPNPVIEWVDRRLPLFTLLTREYSQFPTPKNFNYLWNFGAIATLMLLIMILSGIVLSMHYTPHTAHAFDSVERLMRDVNFGWLIRYIHMNGASFFFVAVYIHIFRGLYYGSFKAPRELLWIFGVLIFLLMMATAFMGYVLPWGQMSYWGATVITGFFSAIPLIGEGLQTWLLGGFSVDNPTLNRFFSLHYLLPFVILGVVVLHVWALHISGSNNPLGIDPRGPQDTLPFHPYYTVKDLFGILLFFIVYAVFVFWFPNTLGHVDNYTPANPLVMPAHIMPEWYFLPFYAILRAVTFGVTPWIGLGLGLVIAGMIPVFRAPSAEKIPVLRCALLLGAGAVFFGLGYLSQTGKADGSALISLPLDSLALVNAKLGGVLAMFGAIAILFVLPWLDTHPVRSARFRPLFRMAIWGFVAAFLVLGLAGAKPAEGIWIFIAQGATLYYFSFFLIIAPVLSRFEKALPLPEGIHESVLARTKPSSSDPLPETEKKT